MELLSHLALGFSEILTVQNLFFCFLGVFLGTAIGVLPGLGPAPTIALLLPLTYALEPVTALIMLAGVFYGSQYGGSTTAILVNIPGESTAVVTALDGYQMARKGRAGTALAIAAIGSFIGGTISAFVVAGFAPPMARLALTFGSADYFSLMVFGMLCAIALAQGSTLKAVAAVTLGLLLGLVGVDPNSGARRFTLGIPELADGIEFIALAMAFFAFAEVIKNLSNPEEREVFTSKVDGLMPTSADLREAAPAVARGTVLGSLLGVLPGGGAILSTWASYAMEKKLSPRPEEFGHGAIRGVAGPETANNAAVQTSMIPMLTLGLPSTATMALMMGAMMLHGIVPGPRVIETNPGVFWGLICSLWVGNVMLLILNLPLVGMWVKLLRVPYAVLLPFILMISCIGLYTVNNTIFDVWTALLFSVVGFGLYKLGIEPAPMLLGFILGPMMEENFRRALLMARGDFGVFVTSTPSLVLMIMSLALLFGMAMPKLRKRRETVFVE